MKKMDKIKKGCRAAAAVLLLSGLTACVNPLTEIAEVAVNTFSESEDAEGDNIEIRELKLRKIEPDGKTVLEENREMIDEAVSLESLAEGSSRKTER